MKRLTEKELAIRIGRNITKYRKQAELTSESLAFSVDTSKGYISDIERGNRLPSLPMLLQIANHLKIDVKELFKE